MVQVRKIGDLRLVGSLCLDQLVEYFSMPWELKVLEYRALQKII